MTLADLAPTTAALIGYDDWPRDRGGTPLPIATTAATHAQGRGDVRDRRRRLERARRVARTLAEPEAADGRGRELPQRDRGVVPRGHGVRARHDRHRRLPARARHHRPQHPRRHRRPQGVRHAGQADPADILVPTLADLWHDADETGAWVGEIGYQVWHLGMLGPAARTACHRRPAGRRLLGRGRRPRAVGAAQPRPVPDAGGGARARRVRGATTTRSWSPAGTRSSRRGATAAPCCAPPIVALPGRPARGDASTPSRSAGPTRPSLLYTTFKSPDYTGHVYGMDSEWTGLMLEAVDDEIGRLRRPPRRPVPRASTC